MMRTAAIIGVVLVSLVIMGGQVRGQGGSDPAVKAIADSYVKASLAGDAKAIAALYADDATEMPPNQPSIKGRAAIEQYYTKTMTGVKLTTFTIAHVESRASGDVAYDVGTYQQSLTPPGATTPVKESGKYVVLLKRTGGAWKVTHAIYNSDQPATR